MSVKFLPEARDELLEAVAYYEGEVNGLGSRLWEEVDRHIAWIERNYEVPRLRPGGYRRVNLKLFPYYISYIVREPVIWILAIAHGHTRPEYWIDRPKTVR
jgi:toxin ParE1/3/4